MEILSVALTNFKTHRDRYFEFRSGTNAICGQNGAGKTSILEAIAWALFDYSSYGNRKELIRAGFNSAQVAVNFSSSHDGRCYEVRRCTHRGYEIYDPQLQVNLGLKKIEDVSVWLRQHLGVSAQTELSKLFGETIGIPQGTFTSDFLKPPEARKRVFDPILKVEEYKQAFTKSSNLDTYAKAQVQQLEQAIAQHQLQLADWPELKQQKIDTGQEIKRDQAQLKHLQQQLAALSTTRDTLMAQAQQLQETATQNEQIKLKIANQQKAQQLLAVSVAAAEQAVELCQTHRQTYSDYQQAELKLQALEQNWQQQQYLQQQRQQQQDKLLNLQTQGAQLQAKLDALQQADAEIAALQPLVAEQVAGEQDRAELEQALQQIQATKPQLKILAQQLAQKQTKSTQLATEIQRLQALQTKVAQIEELEQHRDRAQQQLNRLEAAGQFADELQQIVDQSTTQRQVYLTEAQGALDLLKPLQDNFPGFSMAVNAIQSGLSINAEVLQALTAILDDLKAQTSPAQLTEQLQAMQTQLQSCQQARIEFATLADRQTQHQTLHQEIAELEANQNQLRAQIQAEAELLDQKAQILQTLVALNDPRGQIRLLQQQLQQQESIRKQYQALQKQQTIIQQAIAQLEQQLTVYKDLAAELELLKHQQKQREPGHRTYLQHMQTVEKFPELQQQAEQAIAELATLNQQQQTLHTQWQTQSQAYDPEQLEEVCQSYEQTKTQADQLLGGLPLKQARLAQLEEQLQARQSLAQARDRLQAELQVKQQVQHLISEARSIYNKSGPKITQHYLGQVAREGDRLFRELLNRPDVALKWTEDYEIQVQEEGHWRSFKSLSGGEQMCAALAVRLSLLKVLADIDVAFFDEPTTNMDQPRRAQLAEALGNLRSFRQLFVISHDDTFETMTENIIRVERETL
jgi:DNA repair protein SbcC/Rad50